MNIIPAAGSVVALNSGGPLMTVDSIIHCGDTTLKANCVWMTAEGEVAEAVFRLSSLHVLSTISPDAVAG